GHIRPHGWIAVATAMVVSASAVVLIAPPQSYAQEPAPSASSTEAPIPATRDETQPDHGTKKADIETPNGSPAGPSIEIEARFVEISEAEIARMRDGAAQLPGATDSTSPVSDERV